jgi:hypothetical protein
VCEVKDEQIEKGDAMHEPPEAEWLIKGALAQGSITDICAPRGIGKTHVAHGWGVYLAKSGCRVLLIDLDNPIHEIKRRLKAWDAAECPTLDVMSRDDAPPLANVKEWNKFPYKEYDLVIIDSLDGAQAIAPLLDIAHRPGGPAILILANTIKSGAHGTGSGTIEDQADICFEARDATGLDPDGTKDWWEQLPAGSIEDSKQRSSRRQRHDIYQLAFIPSKLRLGEEPEPFILEIDLSQDRWTLSDVTQEVIAKSVWQRNIRSSRGYRLGRSVEMLGVSERAEFQKLPKAFTTGEARKKLEVSANPLNNRLKHWVRLGLIDKVARGQWAKRLKDTGDERGNV